MQLSKSVQLSAYSTMRVGGTAEYFTEIKTVDDAKQALAFCKEKNVPFFVLGKGSNLILPSGGIQGLVILNKIDFIERESTTIKVGAGYSFSRLGALSAREGLSGLEFSSGIPGTVGGAVVMNAGANGSETKDVIRRVTYLSETGEVLEIENRDAKFAYRSSCFQKMRGIVLSAEFELIEESGARKRQIEIIERRKATQPLKAHSAGCIFRNPEGASAGALIDQCGLKGKRVGGAEISPIHANFIVNRGDAKTEDVLQLISEIKAEVKEKTGYNLECEVRVVQS